MNPDRVKSENRERKMENERRGARNLWRYGSAGNLELGIGAGGWESCYPAGSAVDDMAVIGWRLWRI